MRRLPITDAQRRQIQRRAIIDAQNRLVRALRIVLKLRGDRPAEIDAIVVAILRQVTTRTVTPKRRPGASKTPAQRAKTSEAMRASWARKRSTHARSQRSGKGE